MEKKMVVNKEIRKHLEKHPKVIKKAKYLFGFRYPKLFLLVISIVLAYLFFRNPFVYGWVSGLHNFSYLGIFIAGMLLSFGFSAPFGIGFLLNTHPANLLLGALVGGLGATFSDFLIFHFIRFSFMNELKELKHDTIMEIRKITHTHFHIKVKHYLLYIFAGIIIASPLPDEFGVALFAGLTTIKIKLFLFIAFLLHTSFILLFLFFI